MCGLQQALPVQLFRQCDDITGIVWFATGDDRGEAIPPNAWQVAIWNRVDYRRATLSVDAVCRCQDGVTAVRTSRLHCSFNEGCNCRGPRSGIYSGGEQQCMWPQLMIHGVLQGSLLVAFKQRFAQVMCVCCGSYTIIDFGGSGLRRGQSLR